jgi:hypothetical protein
VAVALSAAALFCAIGGGAYAAASSSKTVTVCVKHSGGELYQAKKCAKHDKKLSWNQKGVAGATGAAGAAGAPGAAGTPGAAGPGAKLISTSAAAGATATGTIDGTWSYSISCVNEGSSVYQNQFALSGPGTMDGDTLVPGSFPGTTGDTGVNDILSIEGGPAIQTLLLQNGGTVAQAYLVVIGTSPCTVTGSWFPVSS